MLAHKMLYNSVAYRVQDMRYLTSFITNSQLGRISAFGIRHGPACLQNGHGLSFCGNIQFLCRHSAAWASAYASA